MKFFLKILFTVRTKLFGAKEKLWQDQKQLSLSWTTPPRAFVLQVWGLHACITRVNEAILKRIFPTAAISKQEMLMLHLLSDSLLFHMLYFKIIWY